MKFEPEVPTSSRRGRGRPQPAGERRTTAAQRQQIAAWFAGRVPEGWSAGPPKVEVDDDEVLVVVTLPTVELGSEATPEDHNTAASARISGWREETRGPRIRIAEEAESHFARQISWGATCGELTAAFTTAAVPVMTRLRLGERQVLDTLIDAGVARSRSEALAWCVRLVGQHEQSWIADLRAAFESVEQVRARGPQSGESDSARPSGA